MKKLIVCVVAFLSICAVASESKIICGNKYKSGGADTVVFTDDQDKALLAINEKIKTAESEGFTKVSAPVGIGYDGTARSFCVTVTKP
mgnify:CR=1 FL=1